MAFIFINNIDKRKTNIYGVSYSVRNCELKTFNISLKNMEMKKPYHKYIYGIDVLDGLIKAKFFYFLFAAHIVS